MEFASLAERAEARLLQQQIALEASRDEFGKLQAALEETQKVAKDANAALDDERLRRKQVERLLLRMGHLDLDDAGDTDDGASTSVGSYVSPISTQGVRDG